MHEKYDSNFDATICWWWHFRYWLTHHGNDDFESTPSVNNFLSIFYLYLLPSHSKISLLHAVMPHKYMNIPYIHTTTNTVVCVCTDSTAYNRWLSYTFKAQFEIQFRIIVIIMENVEPLACMCTMCDVRVSASNQHRRHFYENGFILCTCVRTCLRACGSKCVCVSMCICW